MPIQDFVPILVREESILTNAYVAGVLIDGAEHKGVSNNNQLIIYVDFTIGSLTTAELKVEFANEIMYDFPYDGQSENFNLGKNLKGSNTKDMAQIVSDTDGGATGTLVIKKLRPFLTDVPFNAINLLNTFENNEAITDNGSTPGAAVANIATGITVSDYPFHQETHSAIAGGTSSETVAIHQFSATGKYRLAIPIKDNVIRISVQGTGGAVTDSLMRISAQIGTV